uniref:EGF-like domain-containing protein n=1 Tax=Heterorhabditis bacteriophora TaxID=37862 RepID=A0A1I7X8T5_HETBA
MCEIVDGMICFMEFNHFYADKNECLDKPCHWLAHCQNTLGSYECKCFPGFHGDGYQCADIDECSLGEAHCPENSHCVNLPGTFFCNCTEGFAPKGLPLEKCADINECELNLHNCENNQICQNTIGKFKCVDRCSTGYEFVNGECVDIDECRLENTCDKRAECTNTPGGYKCTCDPGLTGDGKNCSPITDCDQQEDICDRHAFCINSLKLCICQSGYAGDGITCNDVNECISVLLFLFYITNNVLYLNYGFNSDQGAYCAGGCGLHAVCFNQTCQCMEGFVGDPHTKCIDVNECESDQMCAGVGQWCVNKLGGHICCAPDSKDDECQGVHVFKTKDGEVLLQYNSSKGEVAVESGSTSHSSAGSLILTRKGSGSLPSVNISTKNELACTSYCPANSECIDGVCRCMKGFGGNALFGCEDIDECSSLSPCPKTKDSWCVNTIGSFYCCDPASNQTLCIGLEIVAGPDGGFRLTGSSGEAFVAASINETIGGETITERIHQVRNFSAGEIIVVKNKVKSGDTIYEAKPDRGELGLEIIGEKGEVTTPLPDVTVTLPGIISTLDGMSTFTTSIPITKIPIHEITTQLLSSVGTTDNQVTMEIETGDGNHQDLPGSFDQKSTTNSSVTPITTEATPLGNLTAEESNITQLTTESKIAGIKTDVSTPSIVSSQSTTIHSLEKITTQDINKTIEENSSTLKPNREPLVTDDNTKSGEDHATVRLPDDEDLIVKPAQEVTVRPKVFDLDKTSSPLKDDKLQTKISTEKPPTTTNIVASDAPKKIEEVTEKNIGSKHRSTTSKPRHVTTTKVLIEEDIPTSESTMGSTKYMTTPASKKSNSKADKTTEKSINNVNETTDVEIVRTTQVTTLGTKSIDSATKATSLGTATSVESHEESAPKNTDVTKYAGKIETTTGVIEASSEGQIKIRITTAGEESNGGSNERVAETRNSLEISDFPPNINTTLLPTTTSIGEMGLQITFMPAKLPKKPEPLEKSIISIENNTHLTIEGDGSGEENIHEQQTGDVKNPENTITVSNRNHVKATTTKTIKGEPGTFIGSTDVRLENNHITNSTDALSTTTKEFGLEITNETDPDSVGLEIVPERKTTTETPTNLKSTSTEKTSTLKNPNMTGNSVTVEPLVKQELKFTETTVAIKHTSPSELQISQSTRNHKISIKEHHKTTDANITKTLLIPKESINPKNSSELKSGEDPANNSTSELIVSMGSARTVKAENSTPSNQIEKEEGSGDSGNDFKGIATDDGNSHGSRKNELLETDIHGEPDPSTLEGDGETPRKGCEITTRSVVVEKNINLSTESTLKSIKSGNRISVSPQLTSTVEFSTTTGTTSVSEQNIKSTESSTTVTIPLTGPKFPEVSVSKAVNVTSKPWGDSTSLLEINSTETTASAELPDTAVSNSKSTGSKGNTSIFANTQSSTTNLPSVVGSNPAGGNLNMTEKQNRKPLSTMELVTDTPLETLIPQNASMHTKDTFSLHIMSTPEPPVSDQRYHLLHSGVSFISLDVDECARGLHNCDESARCYNYVGGYSCFCPMGYRKTDKGTCHGKLLTLPKIIELVIKRSLVMRTYYIMWVPKCHLRKLLFFALAFFFLGFTGDGYSCMPVEKRACSEVRTGKCWLTFVLTVSESVISDVDECAVHGLNMCDKNAICKNLLGTYSCECKSGFRGDGYMCEDEDECRRQPCHPQAECTNTAGSFECRCPEGFTGWNEERISMNAQRIGITVIQLLLFVLMKMADFVVNVQKVTKEQVEYVSSDVKLCSSGTKVTNKLSKSKINNSAMPRESDNTCTPEWQRLCSLENKTCHVDEEEVPQCGSCLEGHHPINGSCQPVQNRGNCADPAKNNCDQNAECIDVLPSRHFCSCKIGYIGDGMRCDGIKYYSISMNVPSPVFVTQMLPASTYQDHSNATVTMGLMAMDSPVHEDLTAGSSSYLDPNCQVDAKLCHDNARCMNDGSCKCNEGFEGDGIKLCSQSITPTTEKVIEITSAIQLPPKTSSGAIVEIDERENVEIIPGQSRHKEGYTTNSPISGKDLTGKIITKPFERQNLFTDAPVTTTMSRNQSLPHITVNEVPATVARIETNVTLTPLSEINERKNVSLVTNTKSVFDTIKSSLTTPISINTTENELEASSTSIENFILSTSPLLTTNKTTLLETSIASTHSTIEIMKHAVSVASTATTPINLSKTSSLVKNSTDPSNSPGTTTVDSITPKPNSTVVMPTTSDALVKSTELTNFASAVTNTASFSKVIQESVPVTTTKVSIAPATSITAITKVVLRNSSSKSNDTTDSLDLTMDNTTDMSLLLTTTNSPEMADLARGGTVDSSSEVTSTTLPLSTTPSTTTYESAMPNSTKSIYKNIEEVTAKLVSSTYSTITTDVERELNRSTSSFSQTTNSKVTDEHSNSESPSAKEHNKNLTSSPTVIIDEHFSTKSLDLESNATTNLPSTISRTDEITSSPTGIISNNPHLTMKHSVLISEKRPRSSSTMSTFTTNATALFTSSPLFNTVKNPQSTDINMDSENSTTTPSITASTPALTLPSTTDKDSTIIETSNGSSTKLMNSTSASTVGPPSMAPPDALVSTGSAVSSVIYSTSDGDGSSLPPSTEITTSTSLISSNISEDKIGLKHSQTMVTSSTVTSKSFEILLTSITSPGQSTSSLTEDNTLARITAHSGSTLTTLPHIIKPFLSNSAQPNYFNVTHFPSTTNNKQALMTVGTQSLLPSKENEQTKSSVTDRSKINLLKRMQSSTTTNPDDTQFVVTFTIPTTELAKSKQEIFTTPLVKSENGEAKRPPNIETSLATTSAGEKEKLTSSFAQSSTTSSPISTDESSTESEVTVGNTSNDKKEMLTSRSLQSSTTSLPTVVDRSRSTSDGESTTSTAFNGEKETLTSSFAQSSTTSLPISTEESSTASEVTTVKSSNDKKEMLTSRSLQSSTTSLPTVVDRSSTTSDGESTTSTAFNGEKETLTSSFAQSSTTSLPISTEESSTESEVTVGNTSNDKKEMLTSRSLQSSTTSLSTVRDGSSTTSDGESTTSTAFNGEKETLTSSFAQSSTTSSPISTEQSRTESEVTVGNTSNDKKEMLTSRSLQSSTTSLPTVVDRSRSTSDGESTTSTAFNGEKETLTSSFAQSSTTSLPISTEESSTASEVTTVKSSNDKKEMLTSRSLQSSTTSLPTVVDRSRSTSDGESTTSTAFNGEKETLTSSFAQSSPTLLPRNIDESNISTNVQALTLTTIGVFQNRTTFSEEKNNASSFFGVVQHSTLKEKEINVLGTKGVVALEMTPIPSENPISNVVNRNNEMVTSSTFNRISNMVNVVDENFTKYRTRSSPFESEVKLTTRHVFSPNSVHSSNSLVETTTRQLFDGVLSKSNSHIGMKPVAFITSEPTGITQSLEQTTSSFVDRSLKNMGRKTATTKFWDKKHRLSSNTSKQARIMNNIITTTFSTVENVNVVKTISNAIKNENKIGNFIHTTENSHREVFMTTTSIKALYETNQFPKAASTMKPVIGSVSRLPLDFPSEQVTSKPQITITSLTDLHISPNHHFSTTPQLHSSTNAPLPHLSTTALHDMSVPKISPIDNRLPNNIEPNAPNLTTEDDLTVNVLSEATTPPNDVGMKNARCSYSDRTMCHDLAICEIATGACRCKDGFEGDGYHNCTKLTVSDCVSDPSTCHSLAICDRHTRRCQCPVGHIGDGFICSPDPQACYIGCFTVQDCVIRKNLCSPEAICSGRRCKCVEGFTGDGVRCVSLHQRSANCSECDPNAHCEDGMCKCKVGYFGNGLCCVPDPLDCVTQPGVCHPDASCNRDKRECKCNQGYLGNGISCFPIRSCRSDPSVCHVNAICVPSGICICKHGFEGNGHSCTKVTPTNGTDGTCYGMIFEIKGEEGSVNHVLNTDIDECSLSPCHHLATCSNLRGSFICTCPDGYAGDGKICIQHLKIGELGVYCEPDGMTLVLGNETESFEGRMYVRGQAENPHCSKTFSTLQQFSRPYTFKVLFAHCNIRMEEHDTFATTVIVQKHPMFITTSADAYDLRCTYPVGVKEPWHSKVVSHVNVSELVTSSTLTDKIHGPLCKLTVTNENEETIESAVVGQSLKLRLEVTPNG